MLHMVQKDKYTHAPFATLYYMYSVLFHVIILEYITFTNLMTILVHQCFNYLSTYEFFFKIYNIRRLYMRALA